jgi:hypothetical protein
VAIQQLKRLVPRVKSIPQNREEDEGRVLGFVEYLDILDSIRRIVRQAVPSDTLNWWLGKLLFIRQATVPKVNVHGLHRKSRCPPLGCRNSLFGSFVMLLSGIVQDRSSITQKQRSKRGDVMLEQRVYKVCQAEHVSRNLSIYECIDTYCMYTGFCLSMVL